MSDPQRPAPGYTARRATPADAPVIARLHLETLPGDVSDLTPLGPRLVEHFYRNAIARGAAEVRILEDAEGPIAYIMATPDIGTMFQRSLLAGPLDLLGFLLRSRPIGLVRVTLIKLTSGTATVPSAPELVYMGVTRRARGRHLGLALLHQGQLALHEAGFTSYQTNVHADNEYALRQVLARGFRIQGTFEKGGRRLYHLVCDVSPPLPLAPGEGG